MTDVSELEGLLVNIAAERTREQPWLYDDALQEARIGAWQRLAEGKSPGIAVHKARQAATDVVRGRRLTGSKSTAGHRIGAHSRADSIFRHEEHGGYEGSGGGKDYVLELPDLQELEDMARFEARTMLRTALEALDERSRLILWLRFYEGRTYREIGDEVGLTHQRVQQILKASYGKMRARLEDAGA